ncbi:MAG TPA: hypothetical protein VEA78_09005, partial [Acidimicrobiales bacterium]|nr:hypothetical protein [Acidimicrobiales bacterium]
MDTADMGSASALAADLAAALASAAEPVGVAIVQVPPGTDLGRVAAALARGGWTYDIGGRELVRLGGPSCGSEVRRAVRDAGPVRIGVAVSPEDGTDPAELLDLAAQRAASHDRRVGRRRVLVPLGGVAVASAMTLGALVAASTSGDRDTSSVETLRGSRVSAVGDDGVSDGTRTLPTIVPVVPTTNVAAAAAAVADATSSSSSARPARRTAVTRRPALGRSWTPPAAPAAVVEAPAPSPSRPAPSAKPT